MTVTVRSLTQADIPAMVDIERAITQSVELEALERTLMAYLSQGDPDLLLGAEEANEFVGFLIGELRPWEFGEEASVAWIKVVGVHPRHQGKGIGRKLGEVFMKNLKAKGSVRMRTLVPWDSGDLITYFKALGFDRSSYVALERDV